MTRRQVVSYTITCDVCGEEIPESDAENASRRFSWERAQIQVDVCGRHQAELGEVLDKLKAFVDAAAASGGSRGTRAPTTRTRRRGRPSGTKAASRRSDSGNDVAAIRAWAQQNGHTVGDRGRIPATVVAAYNEAAGSATPPSPPARARRSRKAPAPTE